MPTLKQHWNAIFAATADPQLGWYEGNAAQTLKFLDLIPHPDAATIFLPGAGTSVLVAELLSRGSRLILNDISDEALQKLKHWRGDLQDQVTWLCADISKPLPAGLPLADIWIDRAVLHFLVDEADIEGYFHNLRVALRPGGYALLAEFSMAGAMQCAGLGVHRYSVEELCARLGAGFALIQHEDYTFINPAGDPRPYIYALFRRS